MVRNNMPRVRSNMPNRKKKSNVRWMVYKGFISTGGKNNMVSSPTSQLCQELKARIIPFFQLLKSQLSPFQRKQQLQPRTLLLCREVNAPANTKRAM